MLATLVIGLREGLEASLIVGIIAAFLRRTGKPLRPMWIGVGIAVALSIAVGIVLQLISADLPQAQQEGMESIIGLVAVGVVTGMIGWMNTHARSMKADLEAHAANALRDGTAWALVAMAFLAVLKEGFETSVFLLAAFQSSGNALTAGFGAVIGVGIAVIIGVGIFRGGVRLNLARFFRITGIFLVFVAAGLVLSSLRTAHEAGWILVGQQTTLSLSWLAPNGSVQAALLTGVLGIPADPRLIEVLGWAAYLVPTLAYLLWPASKRPSASGLPRVRFGIAAGLAAAGLVLATAVVLPVAPVSTTAPLVGASGATVGHATLSHDGGDYTLTSVVGGATTHHTFAANASTATTGSAASAAGSTQLCQSTTTNSTATRPTTLTLTDLVALSGGRLPIGVNASANPGPYAAAWHSTTKTSASFSGNTLLDAASRSTTVVTISGGGLASPRTLSVDATTPSWTVAANYPAAVAAKTAAVASSRAELLLWKLWLPLALWLAALIVCGYAVRSRLAVRAAAARRQQEARTGSRAPQSAEARA